MIKVFAGDLDGDFAMAVKRLVAVGVKVFFLQDWRVRKNGLQNNTRNFFPKNLQSPLIKTSSR